MHSLMNLLKLSFFIAPFCNAVGFQDFRDQSHNLEGGDRNYDPSKKIDYLMRNERMLNTNDPSESSYRQKKSVKFRKQHSFGPDENMFGYTHSADQSAFLNLHQKQLGDIKYPDSTKYKEELEMFNLDQNGLKPSFNLKRADDANTLQQRFVYVPQLLAGKNDAKIKPSFTDGINNCDPNSISKRNAEEDLVERNQEVNAQSSDRKRSVAGIEFENRLGGPLTISKMQDLKRYLGNPNNLKTKMIYDKSDLELLHDIIDNIDKYKNKRNGKTEKSETDERIKKSEITAIKDSNLVDAGDLGLSKFRINSRARKATEIPKESTTPVNISSSLDTDLEKLIQEAAARTLQFINKNFDAAKEDKQKLKHEPLKSDHSTSASNLDTSKNSEPLVDKFGINVNKPNFLEIKSYQTASDPSSTGSASSEPKKAASIKMLLQMPTTEATGDNSKTLLEDYSPYKRSKLGENEGLFRKSILGSNEVKKADFPKSPSHSTKTQHPDHSKHKGGKLSLKELDPDLLNVICSSSPQDKSLGVTDSISNALSSTDLDSAIVTESSVQRHSSHNDPCDRTLKLTEQIFKQLFNAKESGAEKLASKNLTQHAADLSNLSDFFHFFIGSGENSNITGKHLEIPFHKLENLITELEVNKSKTAPTDVPVVFPHSTAKAHRYELKTETSGSNHIINFNVEDSGKTRKMIKPCSSTEKGTHGTTISPVKALSGFLEFVKKQSCNASTPCSSKHSSTEGKLDDRAKSGDGNRSLMFNVLIKAAIIPEVKNISSRYHCYQRDPRVKYLLDNADVKPPDKIQTRVNSGLNKIGSDPIPSSHLYLFDNTLNNLLKTIIIKSRFDRYVKPSESSD